MILCGSASREMEKGGKVIRGLAQECLINKLKPMSESTALEGALVAKRIADSDGIFRSFARCGSNGSSYCGEPALSAPKRLPIHMFYIIN